MPVISCNGRRRAVGILVAVIATLAGGSWMLIGDDARQPRRAAQPSSAVEEETDEGETELPGSVDLPQIGLTQWTTLLANVSNRWHELDLVSVGEFPDSLRAVDCTRENMLEGYAWWVEYQWILPDGNGEGEGVVASFRRHATSGDVQFQWREAAPEAARIVRNGWLRIRGPVGETFVALRKPHYLRPIHLEFERARQILPLSIDACPPVEQLVLQVSNLAELSPAARFRKQLAEAPFNREVIVEFENMGGAQVGIRLQRTAQGSAALAVDCRFQEGTNRDFDLTYEQLARTHYNAVKTYREAQAKWAALQQSVKAAQKQLKQTEKSPVRDSHEAHQKILGLARIKGAIRDMSHRMENAQRNALSAKARIDAAPKVLDFLKSLHGRSIAYRVVAKGRSTDLVYIDATVPP